MGDAVAAFGSYLYRLRLDRGKETVADFLRDLVIPFTANYYRDVEAGRKKLSIDTAVALHDVLDFDETETVDYFWHYFRDVLPPEIHEALLGKRRVAEASLNDLNERRQHETELRRRALALARYQREFVVDAHVTASFERDFDLLPVMTYVYMVERASETEVARVCKRIGVEYGPRVRDFLAEISDIGETDGERWFARRAPVLRMPRDDAGIALKDRFTLHETSRSLDKPQSSEMFPTNGSFRYSTMVALPEGALDKIQQRLSDLLTELEVAANAGGQLENDTASPYFVAVMISGRPEYNGRRANS